MKHLLSGLVMCLKIESLNLEAFLFEARLVFALGYKLLILVSCFELKVGPRFSNTCSMEFFFDLLPYLDAGT